VFLNELLLEKFKFALVLHQLKEMMRTLSLKHFRRIQSISLGRPLSCDEFDAQWIVSFTGEKFFSTFGLWGQSERSVILSYT
jgi:hypothetical protein